MNINIFFLKKMIIYILIIEKTSIIFLSIKIINKIKKEYKIKIIIIIFKKYFN